ncbi:MAG: hypothetical protein HY901_15590 [Deltaproteobacteria bacterium]|nr:hypothetical protein [Deltaproteobacteria bacterium]
MKTMEKSPPRYQTMKDEGASATDIYRATVADGVDPIAQLRIVRELFGLTLVEAKEVSLAAMGCPQSLDEIQGGLAEDLEQALEEEPNSK